MGKQGLHEAVGRSGHRGVQCRWMWGLAPRSAQCGERYSSSRARDRWPNGRWYLSPVWSVTIEVEFGPVYAVCIGRLCQLPSAHGEARATPDLSGIWSSGMILLSGRRGRGVRFPQSPQHPPPQSLSFWLVLTSPHLALHSLRVSTPTTAITGGEGRAVGEGSEHVKEKTRLRGGHFSGNDDRAGAWLLDMVREMLCETPRPAEAVDARNTGSRR